MKLRIRVKYSHEIESLKMKMKIYTRKFEQNDEYRNLHISLSDKYEKTIETEEKYENRIENAQKQWEEREKLK